MQRCSRCILLPQSIKQPIDRILIGTTTPGKSQTGSNSNERVLQTPQLSGT